MITKYSTLFAALVVLLILLAIPLTGLAMKIIETLAFLLVTLSGVYVASERNKQVVVSIVLGTPVIVMLVLSLFTSLSSLSLLIYTCLIAFLGYTVWVVLRHLFKADNVTTDILFGASSVYLMVGVLWAFIYSLTLSLDPGALAFPGEATPSRLPSLIYFSFTSLTTLGYGDIQPVSAAARTLAILEAIFGVLYTSMLVARLMGLYLARFLDETKRP